MHMPARSARIGAVLAIGAALSLAAFDGDYDTLPAAGKLDYLWQKVIADTKGDSFMNPMWTIWTVMKQNYLWKMTTTHADWWPEEGHHKATHGFGAVAKAHFEWKQNASNYTGMFQQADHCIIRMANAAPPGGIAMTAYGPNLAVKCLRDGQESANMNFIWQVDGYAVIPKGAKNSCSYFAAPLSNHNPLRDDIAMPLKDTFCSQFQKVDPRSMLLGVSQFATGPQHGQSNDIKDPSYPFALVLKPASGLDAVSCTFNEPISQLLNIETSDLGSDGKTLYEVYAVANPIVYTEEPEDSLRHIGNLVLDSGFTSSTFGDTQLFFRHTFFQEDMALKMYTDPDRALMWQDYVTNDAHYKKEGANIYWPLLPGGKEQMAALAAKPIANMLEDDLTVHV